VLRAAFRIVGDAEIIVIGSQAILGSFSEKNLPAEAIRSVEADLAFSEDPDCLKADQVDGAIGEGSEFHAMYSYYGQGVSIDTAMLPSGWKQRVVSYDRDDALPGRAVCLEPHDLVVSKLYAGREKDREFAAALIRAGLVAPALLIRTVEMLPVPGAVKKRIRDSIGRLQREVTGD
jgi:hypothetical protein